MLHSDRIPDAERDAIAAELARLHAQEMAQRHQGGDYPATPDRPRPGTLARFVLGFWVIVFIIVVVIVVVLA